MTYSPALPFPTGHALHAGHCELKGALAILREADLLVSLDWVDLGGALTLAHGAVPPAHTRIIHVSMDFQLHNGWSMDHQAHPPVDLMIAADPDAVTAALAARLPPAAPAAAPAEPHPFVADGTPRTPAACCCAAIGRAGARTGIGALSIPADIDGIAELWFDDMAALTSAMQSDPGQAWRADKAGFVGAMKGFIGRQDFIVPMLLPTPELFSSLRGARSGRLQPPISAWSRTRSGRPASTASTPPCSGTGLLVEHAPACLPSLQEVLAPTS